MVDELDLPYPHYRCPTCGMDLPPNEARMTVTCAEHQTRDSAAFTVRTAVPADRHEIEEICDQALGETEIDVFDRTFDVLSEDNLIAESEGRLAGLLSASVYGGDLVVALLSVYPQHQGHGVGAALLRAAVNLARERGLPSVRAAVSNDDIPLLYFYQRHGFVIYEVALGALADRASAAVAGFSGIPSRDEVRLRRPVCPE
ncbi:MAG TPA: GNAT family N-acetyltransferase [Coriobacteriia bacterium]|nr:GNAT family N-acetyltransferase [Coriobacteriia bacterium]